MRIARRSATPPTSSASTDSRSLPIGPPLSPAAARRRTGVPSFQSPTGTTSASIARSASGSMPALSAEVGQASCRARVLQSVLILVVAVTLQQNEYLRTHDSRLDAQL